MKRKRIAALSAVFCVLLAIIMYFTLPVKLDGEVLSATAVFNGERVSLNSEERARLGDIMAQTDMHRCLNRSWTAAEGMYLRMDILTDEGAVHLYFGDEACAFTDPKASIWYSINDADSVLADIENIFS